MTTPPKPEYPRPQLRREQWTSLNGEWAFAFDDEDRGLADRWFTRRHADLAGPGKPLADRIIVPFAYQAEGSGIASRERHDVVWYARPLDDIPEPLVGQRLLLHFGAVDYHATVWVNGTQVAEHEGGHTPFSADITDALEGHSDVLVVRAEDPLDDLDTPRGKQYWGETSENIFYTPTTGIWQSVWIEPVAAQRVTALAVTPDLAQGTVTVRVEVTPQAVGSSLRVRVRFGDLELVDDRCTLRGPVVERTFPVVPPRGSVSADVADWQGIATWSPASPHLHDLELEIESGTQTLDRVESYFGMRSIACRNGRVYLNGRPFYQRLVLDQGYFPGGLLTAPTDDDLRRDIELAKELGFNGARKHQKVEDPRWLYWADRLGFLVWEEMPSAYRFSTTSVRRLVTEWQEVIARDRNHPCVIGWVPVNESWGVPRLSVDAHQGEYLLALYHLTRSLDVTRPVVSNDGWEHARTDLLTVHDYGDAAELVARHADRDATVAAEPQGRPLYTLGHRHRGEPVIISEFGGIAFDEGTETWGYHTVSDADALVERYERLIGAVTGAPHVQGFCYTQLTDVEQEANGLLTFDRKPKADVEALRRATLQSRIEQGSST